MVVYWPRQVEQRPSANACSGECIKPVAIPTTNVTARPIPSVTRRGCNTIAFMILLLIDIDNHITIHYISILN